KKERRRPVETDALWKRWKNRKAKTFSHRFHSAWKTLRQKRSEFPTVPTGPTTAAIHLKKGNFLSEGWGAPHIECSARSARQRTPCRRPSCGSAVRAGAASRILRDG